MRIGLFSDVHGNLPALEAMLDDLGPMDAYVCLGDIVNYGPWGNECVDLIFQLENVTVLEGNHERYFVEGFCGEDHPLVKKFFDQTFPEFDRRGLIADLDTDLVVSGFHLRHTIGDQRIFQDTPVELDGDYIIGHSHHQFLRETGGFTLCNVGSVGQNRAVIDVVDYATLDTSTRRLECRSTTHDVELVLSEMRARNYPEECVDYYARKPRSHSA